MKLNKLDFEYAAEMARQNDTIMQADPDVPTNFVQLAGKTIDLNSYTYSKDAVEKRLQDAYASRDAAMREQHIIPAADVVDNGFDQDSLDAVDQQIQKLNQTTRAKAPFLTNDQIKQNMANKVRRLQYETQVGEQGEGFFGKLAAHVISWAGSIPYSYKRSIADLATNTAAFAGTAITAGLSGGTALAADAGLNASLFASDQVYDTKKENAALKTLGLQQESLKGAALTGAITGVVAAGIGAVIKGAGGFAGKVVGKRLAEGAKDIPIEEDLLKPQPANIKYSDFINLSGNYAKVLEQGGADERAEVIDQLGNTDNVKQRYDLFQQACKRR